MPKYAVKRHLPGITPDKLQAAGMRAKTCCSEMESEGTDVRWIRSFLTPSTEETYCVFQAPSADEVEEANRRAQIPFEEIQEIAEMTPDEV